MIEIKEILATDTYVVRNSLYKKGKTIENCNFPGDELPTTKHFGLFDNELVGIISLFENKNPIFKDSNQVQLRGLAILENHHGLHLSQKLIENCENILKSKQNLLIWFNAKDTAVASYEKLGYQTIGTIFEIEGVGKHFVMFKKLGI